MINRKVKIGFVGVSSNVYDHLILLQVTSAQDSTAGQVRAGMTLKEAKELSKRLNDEILKTEANWPDEGPISKIGAGKTVVGSSPTASADVREIIAFVIGEALKFKSTNFNIKVFSGLVTGEYKEKKFRILLDEGDEFAGVIDADGTFKKATACYNLKEFKDAIGYEDTGSP